MEVPESTEGQRMLLEAVSGIEGVRKARLSRDALEITLILNAVSPSAVEAELRSLGFNIRPVPKKRKGFFARFLDSVAESNYQSFGGKPLDCCTLHQRKAS